MLAGRYRIESLLGAGGMAWVFRAVDTHLDRPVAIKVLRESASAHTERLRREARAAARLAHPAVVGIHDLGQLSDGRPFIVLEFIDGEPLSRLLAGGPVPAARAVHLLAPVAGRWARPTSSASSIAT
ncbi:MAG: protein kinase [bacterium]